MMLILFLLIKSRRVDRNKFVSDVQDSNCHFTCFNRAEKELICSYTGHINEKVRVLQYSWLFFPLNASFASESQFQCWMSSHAPLFNKLFLKF